MRIQLADGCKSFDESDAAAHGGRWVNVIQDCSGACNANGPGQDTGTHPFFFTLHWKGLVVKRLGRMDPTVLNLSSRLFG